MIVDCHSCGATYNISDDRVRGRRVRVRCKSCGEGIIVDGTQLHADDATRVYSPTFDPSAYGDSRDDAPRRDDATRVMSPGDQGQAGGEWMVNLSDIDQRSMSHDEIVAGYRSGLVTDDAFVWKDGMGDWLPIREVPDFRELFLSAVSEEEEQEEATQVVSPLALRRPPAATAQSQVTYSAPSSPPRAHAAGARETHEATIQYSPARPPPAAARTAPPAVARAAPPAAARAAPPAAARAAPPAAARAAPPARVRGDRAKAAPDLFGSVERAGSEDELLQNSSVPLDRYDAKPTGARNESSVLFSLNTLKAGVAGPNSAPPRVAASAPTAADILGLTAGGSLPGMDAGAQLLSAPAVEALPPPPPPPTRGRMDTTPPAARRSSMSFVPIAVSVGGVAIAAAIFFGLRSHPPSPVAATTTAAPATPAAAAPAPSAVPPPAPPPASPPPAAVLPPTPAPQETAAAATPVPPPAPAAPPAPPVAATPAPPKPAAGGGAKAAPAAAGGSSTDALKAAMKPESKEASSGSQKVVLAEEPSPGGAEAPAAPAAPAESASTFDAAAAKAALEAAASAAPSCKAADGPTGKGKVQVTFSSSGRATAANVIDGTFGGTPVGGCVAKIFRGAKVPPFTGDPVTVSKSFTIPE